MKNEMTERANNTIQIKETEISFTKEKRLM